MSPAISVLIPVYNAEKYLPQCLSSIQRQTFTDFEIICVDDGSTDKTAEILQQWQQKEPRLRSISQRNSGDDVARNRLLQEAQGEYLAFIDADDMVLADYLEKLYNAARTMQADVVKCHLREISEDGENSAPSNNGIDLMAQEIFSLKSRFESGYSRHEVWAKLFRTQFIRKQNQHFPPVRHASDTSFTTAAFVLAKRLAFIPEELYLYRVNRASSIIGQRSISITLDVLQALLSLRDELKKHGTWNEGLANVWIKKTIWRLAVCRRLPVAERESRQETLEQVFEAIGEEALNCRFWERLRWRTFYRVVKCCGKRSMYKWAQIFR